MNVKFQVWKFHLSVRVKIATVKRSKKIYSGKKLYKEQQWLSSNIRVMARQMGGYSHGSLRCLIHHLHRTPDDSAEYEQILALAMCEAVRRFLERGRTIL